MTSSLVAWNAPRFPARTGRPGNYAGGNRRTGGPVLVFAAMIEHRTSPALAPRPDLFGPMLRAWRRRRGASQLALALQSGVSQRHVSFLESGRARPSREMVVQLTSALDVPLRQRNAMLLAAGFAPVYRESNLAAPELTPVRQAIDRMLKQQEPYPAIVIDRLWNLLQANEAANAFTLFLFEGPPPAAAARQGARTCCAGCSIPRRCGPRSPTGRRSRAISSRPPMPRSWPMAASPRRSPSSRRSWPIPTCRPRSASCASRSGRSRC